MQPALVHRSQRAFFNRKPNDFDPDKDYYKILEVSKDADQAHIRNAFMRLAQYYHPDKMGSDRSQLEKFQEITNAYSILSDAKKRKSYDELRQNEGRKWTASSGPGFE